MCIRDSSRLLQYSSGLNFWCRGQDSNLRSTTHWDLIPAPLTARVPLLVRPRVHAGLFHRYPSFHKIKYPIGTSGKQIAKAFLKALHNPSSSPSGILSATATVNSSIISAPREPVFDDTEKPQKLIPTFWAIGGACPVLA